MTPLAFPPKAIAQHAVVLGKTGSGKSSALRHMVEYLLNQNKRVVIIDPKGDWYGIKVAADGKHAGFPIVAFGDFKEPKAQDIPINQQSGKQAAELIATGNRPALIGFRGWMQGAMTRFWIDFASTLFNQNEGDLYLVIDEVHNFAAKGKIMDVEAGKCIHWTNRIMAEGRGLGITCLIASQRPQKVHNDTLTSCETLVAMRVIHEADRNALKEWIDGCGDKMHGKEVLDAVASMPRGDAFVWSPEIGFGPKRIHFPMFETFDSFAPPQLQRKVSESGWSEIDLDDVKVKLAAVIDEQKANDPKELKRKLAAVELELKQAKAAPPSSATSLPAIDKAVKNAVAMRDKFWRAEWQKIESAYAGLKKNVERSLSVFGLNPSFPKIELPELPSVENPKAIEDTTRARGREGTPAPVSQLSPRPAPVRVSVESNGEITKAEKRILNSLAWFEAIGVSVVENVPCAFIAGYTVNGHYNNLKGGLRTKGFLDYVSGGKLQLTDAGRALVDLPDTIGSVADLQAAVMAKLDSARRRVLQPIIDAYPDSIKNDELAAAAGYTVNGHFNNLKGNLRSLGLIEYQDGGCVAKDLLFLK